MTKPVDLDALDAAHGAATPGEWVDYRWSDVVTLTRGAVKVDSPDRQVHVCEVRRGSDGDADCRAIATLHNAYPAMAAELRALRAAMAKVNAIRDSIVGLQTVNWWEHVYPLVAALNDAGYRGAEYEESKANVGTLFERAVRAEAEALALREVAEAAREVSEYHRVYGTETIQDVNVDALRAALAKVTR